MNKKILSLILALAMILSVFTAAPFTVNAEASNEPAGDNADLAEVGALITSVSCTITEPKREMTPDFSPVSGDSSKYTVEVNYWKIPGNTAMTSSDKFEAGKTYTLRIKITPKSGHELSDPTVTVTVKLMQGEEEKYKTTVTGNTATASFTNVVEGKYTLVVSKKDHATREYDISVGSTALTVDAKICPKGDVTQDGKTTQFDYVWALAYSRDLREFDDYQIKCGDVFGKGDGKVTIADANRIAQHARDLNPLYETD